MSLNGRLTAAELVTVDTAGHQLAPAAAASYLAARAAGMPAGIRDAYRTIERQRAYYLAPPNAAGLAAVPGTSPHGWGTALDLDGPQAAWLDSHPTYGWVQTIRLEPWHCEYQPEHDTHQEADMDATQARQLADTRTEVANIQRVAAKLDVALPALVKAATTPAGIDLDKLADLLVDKIFHRLQNG